jgi:hypothetical protein
MHNLKLTRDKRFSFSYRSHLVKPFMRGFFRRNRLKRNILKVHSMNPFSEYTSTSEIARGLGIHESSLLKSLRKCKINTVVMGEENFVPNELVAAIATRERATQAKAKMNRRKLDLKRKNYLRRNEFVNALVESTNPGLHTLFEKLLIEPDFFGEDTDTSYTSGKNLAFQILTLFKQGHFEDTCIPLNKALRDLGNFHVAYPEEIHYEADKLDKTKSPGSVSRVFQGFTYRDTSADLTRDDGGL